MEALSASENHSQTLPEKRLFIFPLALEIDLIWGINFSGLLYSQVVLQANRVLVPLSRIPDSQRPTINPLGGDRENVNYSQVFYKQTSSWCL